MEFEPDEINLTGFDQLVNAVGSKNPPVARLGILSKDVARTEGESTNSEIGAAHEYGSIKRGLPSRSFLRMPLNDVFHGELDNTDLLSEDVFKDVIKSGKLTPWLTQCAILAVATIKKAFASNGFGKWAPWKPGYENNTGDILVDTRQLRDRISYDIKDGD